MKNILSILMAAAMLIALCACGIRRHNPNDTDEPDYKIAVFTGSLSEDKQAFEQARALKDTHGDSLITVTYPHNHDTQPEQTVAAIAEVADDPDVKVMIFAQAVDGTAAGIKKVRETRNDILIITGMNAENASELAPVSDLCLIENRASTGTTIIEQAVTMGAETFVYLSCQSDLDHPAVNTHAELLKETCASQGIIFVEALAPDPTGADGVTGVQTWVNENVPLYVEEYGKNTAFYATNTAMTIPLIQQVAQLGAILPQLCDPSPYHGYPEAFDIDLQEHEADTSYLLKQIKDAVAAYDNSGRMSAWSISQTMIVIQAAVEYSMKWCEGIITERCDRATMNSAIYSAAGSGTEIAYYTDEKIGWISHSFAIRDGYYIF